MSSLQESNDNFLTVKSSNYSACGLVIRHCESLARLMDIDKDGVINKVDLRCPQKRHTSI
jgi:hypothetical protein